MTPKNLMKTNTLIKMAACVSAIGTLHAAPFKSAVISKKINEVKVSEQSSAAKAASSGQKIGKSSTILTGRDSRAELSFADKTITRIGANSVFRFTSGSRDMAIDKGSFLLQVPKNAGGATIRTATVTAAITGTTTLMEYSPGQWVKFICLEGEAEITNKYGQKIKLLPGQMLVMHPDAKSFPALVSVNVTKIMKTSLLADSKIFGPLSPEATRLIAQTGDIQMVERRNGNMIATGVLINGPGPGTGESTGNGGGNTRTIIVSENDSQSGPGGGQGGGGQGGQGGQGSPGGPGGPGGGEMIPPEPPFPEPPFPEPPFPEPPFPEPSPEFP